MEGKINIYTENGYLHLEKYSKDKKSNNYLMIERNQKKKHKLRQTVFCLKRMSQCNFLLEVYKKAQGFTTF